MHEDHIAEKGFTSSSHFISVHKFCTRAHQAMKILDAKAAMDKEWEKLEKLPAWQLTEVKSKKEVSLEAQKRLKESHLGYIDGHMSPQKRGVGTNITAQKQSRAPCHCERFRLVCCTEQGSSAS